MNKDLIINILGIAGVALVAAGIWLLSPAWSLVVVGSIFLAGALAGVWIERPRKGPR